MVNEKLSHKALAYLQTKIQQNFWSASRGYGFSGYESFDYLEKVLTFRWLKMSTSFSVKKKRKKVDTYLWLANSPQLERIQA